MVPRQEVEVESEERSGIVNWARSGVRRVADVVDDGGIILGSGVIIAGFVSANPLLIWSGAGLVGYSYFGKKIVNPVLGPKRQAVRNS
jgi:hypothetical protein